MATPFKTKYLAQISIDNAMTANYPRKAFSTSPETTSILDQMRNVFISIAY